MKTRITRAFCLACLLAFDPMGLIVDSYAASRGHKPPGKATTMPVSPPVSPPVEATPTLAGFSVVADAGGGRFETKYAEVGHIVFLDGSGSYSSDCRPLTYHWILAASPPGSLAVLSEPNSVNPAFVPDVAGDYRVELVVSAGGVTSLSDPAAVSAIRRPGTSLNWGSESVHDNGVDPSIAVNNHGIVVEVHKTENPVSADLYYHVGVIQGGTVEWGPSRFYDTGIFPSVAINDDGVVVEMHANEAGLRLWYHVGVVNPADKSIAFGGARSHDTGTMPSVALNNLGHVVEVHRSEVCVSELGVTVGCDLWYHVGIVDVAGHQINFGASKTINNDHGTTPSVAINDRGQVLEVHMSQSFDDLWYWTGTIDTAARSIHFAAHGNYGTGRNPDVALNNYGRVIEVHQSENTVTAWSHLGFLDGTALSLHGSVPYAAGGGPGVGLNSGNMGPSVALNDQNQFVEMHFSTDPLLLPIFSEYGVLVSHLSTDFLPARNSAVWMEKTPALSSKTLRQITLPGTHDSGAYWLDVNQRGPDFRDQDFDILGIPLQTDQLENEVARYFTLAQGMRVRSQLDGGIRFMDLRITHRGGEFRTYHGLIGDSLSSILDDIRAFMDSVQQEVVIVQGSHLAVGTDEDKDSRGMFPQEHAALGQLIVDKLKPYLHARSGRTANELLNTPFSQLVANGPKVIFIYDNGYPQAHPEDPNTGYFWGSEFLAGGFANTTSLPTLETNQRTRWQEHVASGSSNLFTLFWTFTSQPDDYRRHVLYSLAGSDYLPSLHALSRQVNQHLDTFLQANAPLQPNIILVDFFEESEAVAKAIEFNARDLFAPITHASVSPAPNGSGWNNTDVTVSLAALDEVGGSGVKEIHYQLSGAVSSPETVACGASASVVIMPEGITTVTYWSIDRAGNMESPRSLIIRIDKTPPVVNITASPSILWPPNHKWVTVAIRGSANDSLSGVQAKTFDVEDEYGRVEPPITDFRTAIRLERSREGADFDGRTYTISVTATDKAGNSARAMTRVVCPHDRRRR